MNERRNERTKQLDEVLRLLRQNNFKKYYSVSDLQRKIKAFRIIRHDELKSDLDILSGFGVTNLTHNTSDYFVQKRIKNEIELYKLNPSDSKLLKDTKEISLSLKTYDEKKEIKKKELELKKLNQEVYWYKDLKFWIGLLLGAGISLLTAYLNHLFSGC